MTLADQIIDEAEELAANQILGCDPTDTQIIDAVMEIVGCKFGYNSVGAHLAIAAYNRIDNVVSQLVA